MNSINWVASEEKQYFGSHLGILPGTQHPFEEWISYVSL